MLLKLLAYDRRGGVPGLFAPLPADRGLFKGEFFVLALFALLGMMVMISANHFLIAVPRPGTAVAVPVRAWWR